MSRSNNILNSIKSVNEIQQTSKSVLEDIQKVLNSDSPDMIKVDRILTLLKVYQNSRRDLLP